MLRAALLLLLGVCWHLSADLALMLDLDTPAVQYRADGILGAALALLARDAASGPPMAVSVWRAVCCALAVLWAMHPVCDIYMPAGGVQTASICDEASGLPGSALVLCLIAAGAGWLLDRLRYDHA